MTVVAEITVALFDLPLCQLLSDASQEKLVFETVVPTGEERLPFVWSRAGDDDTFEREARDSELVAEAVPLDSVDECTLYRVSWERSLGAFFEALADTNGALLAASGTDQWRFRLRFAEHHELARFQARCRERGVPVQLKRVSTVGGDYHASETPGLTHKQRDALLIALEQGYFSIPRQTSLAEIATQLGISEQSASERIRRGTETLLQTSLFTCQGHERVDADTTRKESSG
jgi:hypothetical protein